MPESCGRTTTTESKSEKQRQIKRGLYWVHVHMRVRKIERAKERETLTRRENTRKTDPKRQSKYVMESAYTQPLSQTTDIKLYTFTLN